MSIQDLLNDIVLEMDSDAPETCSDCGGEKLVIGRLDNTQYLYCRDCGAHSSRPIIAGVVITSQETINGIA